MATRTVPAEIQAQIDTRHVNLRILVELEFSGATIRMWNGVGNLVALGQRWTGVGDLLSVSEVRESTELKANGVQVVLSGVPSYLISAAYAGFYQGRPGRVYLGVMA